MKRENKFMVKQLVQIYRYEISNKSEHAKIYYMNGNKF